MVGILLPLSRGPSVDWLGAICMSKRGPQIWVVVAGLAVEAGPMYKMAIFT
jgi:hypothetical protein